MEGFIVLVLLGAAALYLYEYRNSKERIQREARHKQQVEQATEACDRAITKLTGRTPDVLEREARETRAMNRQWDRIDRLQAELFEELKAGQREGVDISEGLAYLRRPLAGAATAAALMATDPMANLTRQRERNEQELKEMVTDENFGSDHDEYILQLTDSSRFDSIF